MALINCPECNGNVSTAATTCPHCGFPLEKYIAEKEYNDEVERLMSKIKPCEFTVPEPRAKVCIKCGEPWLNHISQCNCRLPGVDVEYPERQFVGYSYQRKYILDNCVIPYNIGDYDSIEYRNYVADLDKRIEDDETYRSKQAELYIDIYKSIRDEQEFPNPKFFGFKGETSNSQAQYNSTVEKKQQPASHVVYTERAVYTPACPYCKSTSLTKISTVKKAGKVALFGIFGAGDIGKTYKCNKCGCRF